MRENIVLFLVMGKAFNLSASVELFIDVLYQAEGVSFFS
jgi:hypothetical protein